MSSLSEYFSVSMGGIILYSVMEYLLNGYIGNYKWFFIIAGLAIAIFSSSIHQKINLFSKEFIIILGGILFFIGVKPMVIGYIPQYWYIFLIVGLILILAAKKIGEWIR